MKTIALCFLTTKNIVNLDVWETWWRGNENKINIYAHFSKIGDITQQILLDNRVKPVPTRWGDISLIYAEGELYKESISNKDNTFFILLSENCVPVRDFDYVYDKLMEDTKRGIISYRDLEDAFSEEDSAPFITKGVCNKLINKLGFFGDSVYASDQWKSLSRKNVRDFISMLNNKDFDYTFNSCIEIIPDSLAPDELMYINFLNRKYKGDLNKAIRHGIVTFVNFTGKAVHPVNYRQLTKTLKEDICFSDSLFARKFPNPIKGRIAKQFPVKCNKKGNVIVDEKKIMECKRYLEKRGYKVTKKK